MIFFIFRNVVVGSIFNNDSVLCRTAFKYEYEKHNNNSASVFRFEPYFQTVDVADSFDVLKASEFSDVILSFSLY